MRARLVVWARGWCARWCAILAGLLAVPAQAQEAAPWRLQAASGTPAWLNWGIEHRSRMETLRDDFRAAARGDGSAWMMRTLLSAEARLQTVAIGLEVEIGRAHV